MKIASQWLGLMPYAYKSQGHTYYNNYIIK